MTNPTTAVNPSPESLEALAKQADDGPIVMVNLLKFAEPDGRRRYGEYARVASKEIASRGGHVIYSGQFLVTQQWDTVCAGLLPDTTRIPRHADQRCVPRRHPESNRRPDPTPAIRVQGGPDADGV